MTNLPYKFCEYLFLQFYIDGKNYTSANRGAEYGIHRAEYAMTNEDEVMEDMNEFFFSLENERKEYYWNLWQESVRNDIVYLQELLAEKMPVA